MKVAIIGTVPVSRQLAPYHDASWKIWACSPGNMGQVPRVDAWFELHSVVECKGPENQVWAKPYFEWLRAQPFPVYMQEPNDLVPGAIVYPLRDMLEKFGRNWFSSSVAYMMAFAINQMSAGDEIGIYGVDMAATEEHYSAQKAGCLRMIEIANERGIKVHVPFESCLGQQPPLYAYSESTRMGRKLNVRRLELVNKRRDLAAQRERLDREICFFDGAIEDINYVMRTFTDGADAELAPPHEIRTVALPPAADPVPGPQDFEPGDAGLLVPKGTKANGRVASKGG